MNNRSYSQYVFGKSAREVDPEVSDLVEYEQNRQSGKIVLIPSESICPAPVLEVLGSAFNNIYAEGYIPSIMVGDDEELLGDSAFLYLGKLVEYGVRAAAARGGAQGMRWGLHRGRGAGGLGRRGHSVFPWDVADRSSAPPGDTSTIGRRL